MTTSALVHKRETQNHAGSPDAGGISSGLEPHDHRACKRDALQAARALCQARGVRLTPARERVLELIWESHAPMGAYDILERLTAEHKSAKPPTVYRALSFLVEQGFVHRIDSRNAFVGCAFQNDRHRAGFLICSICGNVAEFDDQRVFDAIAAVADNAGFNVQQETVEVSGICQGCLDRAQCA